MKKAQGTGTKKKATKGGTRKKPAKGKQVDMNEVRTEITNLVGDKAVGMVTSTIHEADKGHYPAMKYLFEMVGLYPEGKQAEAAQGDDVLAKTLLRRLDLPEEPAAGECVTPGTSVTKESESRTVGDSGDPVK